MTNQSADQPSKPRPLGQPTWLDINTSDAPGTTQFYTDLFGWTFADMGSDFSHYAMITNATRLVGGYMDVSTLPGGPMPSRISVYLATDDIQDTSRKVVQAGGDVVMPAQAAGPAGSYAIVTDPTGAVFGLWQAAQTVGFQNADATSEASKNTGAPVWFELMSMDIDAAARFYTEVFGWRPSAKALDAGPGAGQNPGPDHPRYLTNAPAQHATAGLCDASIWLPEGTTSYWRVYFSIADVDAAARTITEAGGTVLDGPIDSPFGRIASIKDQFGLVYQLRQELPRG